MHWFVVFVVAFIAFTATGPANAQSIDDVLKAFGLIGTWSPDCSDKKSQPRLTFTGGGKPAAAFTNPAQAETGEANVTAAARVTDEKISVTVMPARKNGKEIASNSSEARPQTILLEKVGNKIKGPGGPPFEKCLN
jgi:hypothetical protein